MQETFIDIKALDGDARGVGHLENEDGTPGKVIFVEGALPGERVSFETLRKKKNWESGRMVTLQRASSMRVEPSAGTSATAAAARCSTWSRRPRSP